MIIHPFLLLYLYTNIDKIEECFLNERVIKVKGNFKFSNLKKRDQLLMILFILIVICIALFAGFKLKYKNLFYSSTYINGVNVSQMTIDEASEALEEKLSQQNITIKDKDQSYTYSLKDDLDLTYDLKTSLTSIKEKSDDLIFISQIFDKKTYTLNNLKIDEDKLKDAITTSSYYKEGNKDKTTNAVEQYNTKTNQFEIKKEYQGTNIAVDDFIKTISEKINKNSFTFDLTSGKFYVTPTILSDNKDLVTKVKTYNEYIGAKITYQMPSTTVICDSSVYYKWLTYDNEVSLNEDKIKDYVKDLANKYDTYNKKRSFKTTNKGTITISGGSLGYLMNQSKEVTKLKSNIENKETVSRKPIYSKEEDSNNGVGNTYVEVDLSGQHIYYYKNGSLFLQSDCVTGNPNKGNATPTGTYRLTYKQSPATLKGRIDPTTGKREYETPVTYWMPFNGGVGFHDATWQPTFGGTRYLTNGSHGCVNLPLSVAATLYKNISAGTLVIVY
jgi:lipoprotein-anchoring transpeptidase ErfK/SrfK